MKSVVFRGPVLTQSGYGVHCRQVAKWLLNKHDNDVKFIPTPWGDTPWIINKESHGGLIEEIMKRTVNPENIQQRPDISFQLQLPNEWDPQLARFNVGMSAVVETDRCSPAWVSACNAMNMVIVPSNHAKQCLLNSGNVTVPLLVVPESFSESIEGTVERPSQPLEFSTSFNFLIFGQITGSNPDNDRKNTFYMIKWLCETFAGNKDVGIVIKTNCGRNSLIDKNVTTNMLKQLMVEVRKGPYPRLHLLHGDMEDDDVALLYKHPSIKALIALTRGEGFGLPILEAAASGLPVIATGWSGHLDFLNLGKFISVYYQLGNVHPSRVDGNIFVKGARWAHPSEEDFKKRVAKFHEKSSTPKEWAAELQQKIVSTYSFKKICEAYDSALHEVL